MKNLKYIGMLIIAGIMITGCDWHGNQTIVGTGDVESMEVELPDFEGVSVTGTCNVEVTIGETQPVTFYAQSEVLDVLMYEVRDGILQIGFKPDYTVNTSEEISAEIVIPSLTYVAVTGAGDFDLSGDQQELLDIHITGTGNVEAFDMEVEQCNIWVSGVGNCEVNVINSLDITISGVGNVWYMGTPSLSTDVSGVGNITAVNP